MRTRRGAELPLRGGAKPPNRLHLGWSGQGSQRRCPCREGIAGGGYGARRQLWGPAPSGPELRL